MEISNITKQWLENELQTKSCDQIASELSSYPNKIRRLAKKLGIKLRSSKEAQVLALKTGRAKHPTAGLHRDDKTKLKISQRRTAAWLLTDQKYKDDFAQKAKERWHSVNEVDRKKFLKNAHEHCRLSAKEGSRLERFILKKLTEEKYHPDFHKEKMLVKDKLQIDIFIPELGVAIEVDGPSHHNPVWGPDKLKEVQTADETKNGLLIQGGFTIIRVSYNKRHISLNQMQTLWEGVRYHLQKIRIQNYPYHERLIRVEMKND